MCVTNIYVDQYPSKREIEFRKLSICQYGYPGRPCPNHSTLENPVRKIQFGEATTEQMLTTPVFPSTPPHSQHRLSGGSSGRYSVSPATSEDRDRDHHRRRSSLKPSRTHRKERIIIVDAPPTPRTPPQVFPQPFTAPSSPNPRFSLPRGRPIIVDERSIPLPRGRTPSVGPILGASRPITIVNQNRLPRSASLSRPAHSYETPISSYASQPQFLETHSRRHRRESSSDDARRARLIAEQDEMIRRRPAVPIVPRSILRPSVQVEQSQALSRMMGGLSLAAPTPTRQVGFEGTLERRRLEREAAVRARAEAAEAEAQKQRLRERQMPKRRFSVGPGHRRHRVLYDDGVYRWE